MRFAILDRSAGLLSPSDVGWMVQGVRQQLRMHVAPMWNHADPPDVRAVQNEREVDDDETPVYLLTAPGETGELGDRIYSSHWGRYVGRIFAGPILDANPGCVLYNPSGGPSVCRGLSHECDEGEVDGTLSAFLPTNDGRWVSMEICDPFSGRGYELQVSGWPLMHLANFAGPRWFDRTLPPGTPCDFDRTCNVPLQIGPAGYAIFKRADGSLEMCFGDYPPPARNILHHFNSPTRAAQRLGISKG